MSTVGRILHIIENPLAYPNAGGPHHADGMTLRDYFAGIALPIIMQNDQWLVDTAAPDVKACIVNLPYPARRCGIYVVECSVCQRTVGITTAGRPDDPRTIRIGCRQTLQ